MMIVQRLTRRVASILWDAIQNSINKKKYEDKHDVFLSHAQKNSADLCRSIQRSPQDFKISACHDMQAKRLRDL